METVWGIDLLKMERHVIMSGLGTIWWELVISYKETLNRIEKYAKTLISHELLAITDGSEKRCDGTPVRFIRVCSLDSNHWSLLQELSRINHFSICYLESQWYCSTTVRNIRSRGSGVYLYKYIDYRQIICEMELTSILCSVANATNLLLSYDGFVDYLRGLKNIIIVSSLLT